MRNVNIVPTNEYILCTKKQFVVVMERLLVVLVLALGAVLAQKDPHAVPGRSAIVHLFEWRFQDIARECEEFLAPYGYAGVQTSPVNENLVITTPNRPWYERYQPISYQLTTRSGTESEFRDMVRRCNNVGVRIYVDAVINHMSANANNAVGTAGNTADPQNLLYPAVPYGPGDFHPPCDINNYNDLNNVRDCELVGLHDLDQSKSYVREKLIEFMDTLVDAGVAGFRVDAAKHMWPEDLEYIYGHVKDLSTEHGFQPGSRPFYYQEVIDYGGEATKESDYTGFGRVTEFKFGRELSNAMSGNNAIKWLKNFGVEWGFGPSEDVVVFVDNHDTQRADGVLTYKQAKLYKMAVAFMLAWPYGYPRVMSSFAFDNHDQGPPHDSNNNILPVTVNPDHTCNNGWVCEHRWRQIYNMVGFRNIVHGTSVNDWWDNGDKQIAFCRGNKGFIAINDQYNTDLKQTLQVCLPSGTYCDIISGSRSGNSCTGKSVTVNTDGHAYIEILASEEDGVLAIHAESKL